MKDNQSSDPMKRLKLNNSNLISIILLSYDSVQYTAQCIESVIQNTIEPYELIVFDHGSSNSTVLKLKSLQEKYPFVKFVFKKTNLGFAGGNNKAATYANGKYLCFISNDILVPYNWLNKMSNTFQLDKEIGAVGPVSNSISGTQMIKQEYELNNFYDYSNSRLLGNHPIRPCRRLAGFVIFTSKKIFNKINGFDENYGFGNFEDDDLSLKIRNLGYKLFVDESVYIHHFGSITFKEKNIDMNDSLTTNYKIFKEKWPDIDYEELLEIKNP